MEKVWFSSKRRIVRQSGLGVYWIRTAVIGKAQRSRQALDEEKEPEVRWKLSFISLVAGGMKLEAAIAHFGIGIATAYKWIRRWNDEGVEGLKRRKIPREASKIV